MLVASAPVTSEAMLAESALPQAVRACSAPRPVATSTCWRRSSAAVFIANDSATGMATPITMTAKTIVPTASRLQGWRGIAQGGC
jgi:hypothetical protein